MEPNRYAEFFRTPMLILHGERDYRVPITQGLELYGTLTAKGFRAPRRLSGREHWILKGQNAKHWYGEVSVPRDVPQAIGGGRPSMKYTTLGRTGITVSRLCLGCMSYGSSTWRPWILDGEEPRGRSSGPRSRRGSTSSTRRRLLARPVGGDHRDDAEGVHLPRGDRPRDEGLLPMGPGRT